MSFDPIKLLYIGNSSTGKTGSLVSLVEAGYIIGMIDFDNGVKVLRYFAQHRCPDKAKNIRALPFRDEYGLDQMNRLKVKGQPRAFANAVKATQEWDDKTKPAEWGENHIFVVDSLSTMGKAAHAWAESINPSAKEPRTWFHGAQQAIENYISMLTSPLFKTHVIVISHVDYVEDASGMQKGFASSIGKALGPTLPKYFNNLILAESSGSGKNTKRVIKTLPTGVIDLKNEAPFMIDESLPLDSGLATIFSKLKG